MDSWVMVPCQRSRLPLLKRLLVSLEHPTGRVVIVATNPNPLTREDLAGFAEHVILFASTEISISKWWNFGLDYIAGLALIEHEVLSISSDYMGEKFSVGLLAQFMRNHQLAMVGPAHHGPLTTFRLDDRRDLFTRVPGACWMLAGETKLRVDENFRWWYSDDDLEMQARRHSGAGVIPQAGLIEGITSGLDDQRQQWATEDRERFVNKWGRQPW